MRKHGHTHRPSTLRAAVAGALLVAATLAAGIGPVAAAQPPPFTISPVSLTFDTTLNNIVYDTVTLTTGSRRIAVEGPSSIGPGTPFADTQAGTCWQLYGALGQAVPAKTSCTIQVSYMPTGQGPYSATMTVYACKKWHLDPTFGFIVCDQRDGSQAVALNGTVQLPDLVITNITVGDGGVSPYGYRVTVKNVGAVTADLTDVSIQGYYSPDNTTYDGSTQNPACGTTFNNGDSLAVNSTQTVTIGCAGGPGQLDQYLGVKVDAGSALIESDETNNITHVGIPDLVIDSIVFDGPSEAWVNNWTATIKNIGTGAAVIDLQVLTVQAWWSSDTTLDGGDTPACGALLYGSPGTLAVGATIDAQLGCGVAPAGANYLLVEADVVNGAAYPVVPELDETNNGGSIALT